MYFAYSFSINAQSEYLAVFKCGNDIEVATVRNSTAGFSIKKEEDSTKNQSEQPKQQFCS